MLNIQFRKAVESDLDYIADVLESILPMYTSLIPGAFERQIEKFRVLKKFPVNYELWLIINNQEPIGFFGVESLSSESVYLAAFYLHTDYHRMQLGSVALTELIKQLQFDSYRELLLFAHKEAYWAIDFYLKNGFEMISDDVHEIRRYKNGILAEYFLPRPLLLGRNL